jgi:hypothetical protein
MTDYSLAPDDQNSARTRVTPVFSFPRPNAPAAGDAFRTKNKECRHKDGQQGENIPQCGHEILPEILPAACQRPKYIARRASSIISLFKTT